MKLYVGNLSYHTAESNIEALFATYGAIASVQIVRDRATGQSRGFGFVEMSDDTAGQTAMKTLDQYEFEGRRLTVNEAKPQERRSFGGGGGGNGGGGGRQSREPRW